MVEENKAAGGGLRYSLLVARLRAQGKGKNQSGGVYFGAHHARTITHYLQTAKRYTKTSPANKNHNPPTHPQRSTAHS
jgi:hypothetical protein